MTDIASLSTEELLKLYQQPQKGKVHSDLSSMSTEELLRLHQQPQAPSFDQMFKGGEAAPANPALEKGLQAKAAEMRGDKQYGMGEAFATGAAKGLSFNAADEALAGIYAGLDYVTGNNRNFSDAYSQQLKRINDGMDAAQAQNPWSSTAGEITGFLPPGAALSKAGATASRYVPEMATGAKGLAMRAAAGGADGLALGALTGAMGAREGERLDGAAIGGILGGAAGIAAPVVASGLTKAGSSVLGLANKKPPSVPPETFKDAASAAYKSAEDAGVIFSPQATSRLRDAVQSQMADFGFDPTLQPGAYAAFKRLDEMAGQNATMKGLDIARRVAKNSYNPTNPSNNALSAKISESIDNLIMNPGAGDVIGGNTEQGAKALRQAREFTARQKKLEIVDNLMERAGLNAASTGSGGNVENATRQQLKRLLTDPKLSRGMTPDENEALKKAVLGTPTQNALRLVGKLSPQGNGLMLALNSAHSAVSPMTGIPAMAAGYLSKKAAESMTGKSAKYVRELVAAGGKKEALEPAKNAAQKAVEANREALARLLLMSGIASTAQ